MLHVPQYERTGEYSKNVNRNMLARQIKYYSLTAAAPITVLTRGTCGIRTSRRYGISRTGFKCGLFFSFLDFFLSYGQTIHCIIYTQCSSSTRLRLRRVKHAVKSCFLFLSPRTTQQQLSFDFSSFSDVRAVEPYTHITRII